MTLQQIIDLSKNGELKNTAVKDDTLAILGYINLGLLELYKRFTLDTKEIILTLGSNGDTDNPYTMIDPTTYQMPSDFLYMVSAYDEVPSTSLTEVVPIQINNENNPLGINMVSWNKVQVPLATTGAHISIIYVPSPSYFTSDDITDDLPLPPQFIECMLLYIAYKAHSSVTVSSANGQNPSAIFYARFEASCEAIKQLGIYTAEDMDMTVKFRTRGFA